MVCSGAATLAVPAGVTFGVTSNCFVTTGATVTKTGAGVWLMKSEFRTDRGVAFAGTRWVIHEGTLKLFTGDAFGGHTTACPLVLEAHEGARIELAGANTHTPVCGVVLRGATLFGHSGQFGGSDQLEGGSRWHGFGLNGPVTVEPSSDGRPSTIFARASHLAHGTKTTVFDVKDGATLVVDTVLNPGWNNGCSARNESGLVKTGGGTLKLLRQVGTKGTFDIRGGTVALGPKAALNDNLQLSVDAAAKLALDDGAQIVAPTAAESALCGQAEVWFDASRLAVTDGAAVSSVPNYGTAGGTFDNVKCQNNYTPTAPTFVQSGIGGRGCLMFDGSQSIVTTAHTNTGVRMQVFLVSKWTSWQNKGGFGLYGGPFSMMAKNGAYTDQGDDNQSYGSLSYNNWSGTVADLKTCTKGVSTVSMNPSGISVGVPYITHSGYDKEALSFYSEVWTGAEPKAATNTLSSSTAVNCNVDTVCIGGRLRLGVPQIWGKDNGNNRQYIGQIGEVLVFTRQLTGEETATVYAYLKRKWFGVDTPTRDGSASRVTVEVAEGASAGYAANVSVSPATTPLVVKTGAGSLRLGGSFAGEAQVAVEEGGLALDDRSRAPQVDVWVDASESAGMSFDSDGRVTNLVNRGSCGGAFVRNGRKTPVPSGPQWTETGINGRPALVFDGDSALALDTYRNTTSPRRVSVYFVGVRTRWEMNPNNTDNGGGWGRWAGPWNLGYTGATASDESVSGVCHVEEDSATSTRVDCGNTSTGGTTSPPTGEPHLMVCHSCSNMVLVAYETNKTSAASVPRTVVGCSAEPLNIDLVQLGARTAAGGGSQWYGHDHGNNRMWYGKVGEFIVTTEPLSYQQEVEFFAYLRKKWFDKGTGSATPPAWLTGAVARPELGDKTVLTMADGTSLRHAASAVTLGALQTEGTVAWTREWDGTLSTFPMFEVGAVSLGNVQLCPKPAVRKGEAKILGYEEAVGTPAWQVFRPDGKFRPAAQVTDRGDGYWLLDQIGILLLVR